jgi:hypothetical protein
MSKVTSYEKLEHGDCMVPGAIKLPLDLAKNESVLLFKVALVSKDKDPLVVGLDLKTEIHVEGEELWIPGHAISSTSKAALKKKLLKCIDDLFENEGL